MKEFLINLIPDKFYLSYKFKKSMGKKLDLKNPKTYNEKIQWLKLYDRKEEYTKLVDKYESKIIVSNLIGDEYIIPTLGVWDNFDSIDFNVLPDQFILKTTHDSGSVIVCKNKNELDINNARRILEKSLKNNYYYSGREWPYKNIKPRIICEAFLDNNGNQPDDYKILCFNGVPNNTMVCVDRETGTTKYYFFDKDWKLMRCNGWGKKAPEDFTLPKPINYEKMIEIAKILSKDKPLVRIDLYNIQGKIYFGEITFYPDSGFDYRILPETDFDFGEKLRLPL